MNVGVNQFSALLRAPHGASQLHSELRDLVRRAALEVVAISEKVGTGLPPADVERFFPILDTLAPEGKTSMLQDVEAGRRTGVDAFAGTSVAMGPRHGVPTPVNGLLLGLLRAAEALAAPRE